MSWSCGTNVERDELDRFYYNIRSIAGVDTTICRSLSLIITII